MIRQDDRAACNDSLSANFIQPPFEFWATIAVSATGLAMLMSATPSFFHAWIIDGDFPDDSGWTGLPEMPGLWNCRFRVEMRYGEPEICTMEFEKTDTIIESVSVTKC